MKQYEKGIAKRDQLYPTYIRTLIKLKLVTDTKSAFERVIANDLGQFSSSVYAVEPNDELSKYNVLIRNM